MFNHLLDFLLIRKQHLQNSDPVVWKISALRIIAFVSVLLVAAITLHSAWKAFGLGLYAVIPLAAVCFLGVFCLILCLPAKHVQTASVLLVVLFLLAGLCILFFVSVFDLVALGIVFIYTLPLLVLVLFGFKWSLLAMIGNVAPFLFVLSNQPLVNLFYPAISLEQEHLYIQGLLFTLFNICIPLTVARVLFAMKFSSETYERLNKDLTYNTELYREVFEHSGAATLICERQGRILKANDQACHLLGYNRQRLEDRMSLVDLVEYVETCSACNVPEVFFKGRTQHECSLISGHGEKRYVIIRHAKMTNSDHHLVSLIDITSLRETQQALFESKAREIYLTLHDRLTGLPNREQLIRRLSGILVHQLYPSLVTVACIGLNHLTYINEKYGRATGDKVIVTFSRTLKTLVRRGGFLARLRAGIFTIVVPNLSSQEEVLAVISTFYDELARELVVDGVNIEISTSMGVAFYPNDASSADELLRKSELALDCARQSVTSTLEFFDERFPQAIWKKVELEFAIKKGLASKEFFLVYQPKVDNSGTIQSLEALVRWKRDGVNQASPSQFIPFAEETGLIKELDSYVLDVACQQIRHWVDRFGFSFPVAVNVSAKEVTQSDLVHRVVHTAERYQISPELLEIEITETSLMQNESVAIQRLYHLENSGFKIALDDFGTGYSSLSKLSDFPISTLKIDRSFVESIPGPVKRENIIKSIISLANALGFSVVAEGVETAQQLGFLRGQGCRLFQGYYFYRPMSVDDVEVLFYKE